MDWLSPLRQIFSFTLPVLDAVPGLRAIIGVALVFFLPGFAWTLIFFKEVNVIERVALSFGLSIALVTLSVLALNLLFGVRISGLNALLTIVVITAVPLGLYYLRRSRRGRALP